GELLEAVLVAADDDQVVAVRGEAFGEGLADAGGCAGDQGELAHDGGSFQRVAEVAEVGFWSGQACSARYWAATGSGRSSPRWWSPTVLPLRFRYQVRN